MISPQKNASAILTPEAEDDLESALRDAFAGRDLEIYRMMTWQLGHVSEHSADAVAPTDRRLHGTLLLATAQILHGEYAVGLKYAVAVELMHNFWLIHNDVQDGNTERSGRASVWWKWGPSQAINTGDGMHALVRYLLFQLYDDGHPLERISTAVEIIDDAVLHRCEGEFLDASFQEQPAVEVKAYLEMVQKRTGALFGASTELASILSDNHDTQLRAELRRFGEKVGIAKQLVADYLAIFGERERDPIQQARIISKKKSLPIAYLFDTAKDPSVLRQVGEMYMQRVIDPSRISDLSTLAAEAGAREYTLTAIEEQLTAADKILVDIGISNDHRNGLMKLAREIADIEQITLPD